MDNSLADKWLILIEEKEAVVGLLTERGTLLVSEQSGWDGEDAESLVAGLDSGIGNCLAKEDGMTRPKKTIFILPPFWVSNQGEVLPSHKEVLKLVCQKLNLVPEGFLVGEEVLSNFYSDFVSIYFGKEYLRFSVIVDKSLELQEELENGEDIDPEDVSVFLRQLNGKAIVPKQLYFWGRIKQGNKERLLSYPWQEEKVFDSSPQLKVLLWPEFFDLVAKVVRGEVKLEVVEAPVIEEEKSKSEPMISEEVKEKSVPEDKEKIDGFGFTSADVAEIIDQQPDVEVKPKTDPQPQAAPAVEIKPEAKIKKQKKPAVKSKLGKPKLPKINLPNFSFKFLSRKIVLVIFGILILLTGGLFLGWRFSKATVEIFVTPEDLDQSLRVSLDTETNSLDLETGIIPAESVAAEKSGKKSKPTSGEELVGDKAAGEVKIFNRTGERGEFSAGTKLVGPGGLEFVLDDDVSVASKTADLDTGVDRWGETRVAVTAADIGPEYNLAEESLFSIGGYSDDDFLARNSQAFAGGTSRQIRVVDESDLQTLRQDLSEDLISQAEEELEKKIADGQIISGSLSTKIIEEKFSGQVGDQVDNLSLELTAQVSAAQISSQRLIEIGELVLQENLDPDMEIRDGSIRAKFNPDEDSKPEAISGELILKAKAYPKIDYLDLSQQIAGKRENQAKQLIRNQYSRIYRYQISYQLPIFQVFSYLPSQPENIIIEIRE